MQGGVGGGGTLTRCNLVVMGRRAIPQHVLHLQELVGPVAPDYGEAESQGALPEGGADDGPLQLGGVPCEAASAAFFGAKGGGAEKSGEKGA